MVSAWAAGVVKKFGKSVGFPSALDSDEDLDTLLAIPTSWKPASPRIVMVSGSASTRLVTMPLMIHLPRLGLLRPMLPRRLHSKVFGNATSASPRSRFTFCFPPVASRRGAPVQKGREHVSFLRVALC